MTDFPIYTDRSRMQEAQRCLRARWWAYEHGRDYAAGLPGGIAPIGVSIPLSTGIFVHVGLEHLLRSAHQAVVAASPMRIDEAVSLAKAGYADLLHGRGLTVEDKSGDPAFTAREQEALIEGLIRAWAIERLPKILAQYEVLEVEVERELLLSGGDRWENGEKLIWQSRADALFRRRSDAGLFVGSWKTLGGKWDRRKESECRHDVQGLSEAAAIEVELQRVRRNTLESANNGLYAVAGELLLAQDKIAAAKVILEQAEAYERAKALPTKIEGVLMEFLLKGERKKGDGQSDDDQLTGPYIQHSPLIRARRRPKTDPVSLEQGYEYAWSFYWSCSAPHPMRKSKWYPNGTCDGLGKRHKLGDDWEVFNVWEQTDPFRIVTDTGVREFSPGVKGWIDALAAGAIQPEAGPCLPAQFVTPLPYYRQQSDIEDWREQANQIESEIAEHAELVRLAEDPENKLRLLNRFFPQTKRACDWPVNCPFNPICHESTIPVGELDPLQIGVYQLRVPHHEPELRACEQTEQPMPEMAESEG